MFIIVNIFSFFQFYFLSSQSKDVFYNRYGLRTNAKEEEISTLMTNVHAIFYKTASYILIIGLRLAVFKLAEKYLMGRNDDDFSFDMPVFQMLMSLLDIRHFIDLGDVGF